MAELLTLSSVVCACRFQVTALVEAATAGLEVDTAVAVSKESAVGVMEVDIPAVEASKDTVSEEVATAVVVDTAAATEADIPVVEA